MCTEKLFLGQWEVDSSWNVMSHGDARVGKWGGNLRMEWVASTLHTTSEHGVSKITTADAHTSATSSRLNWRPRRFKWTRPFRLKTKSGLCEYAITFQLASTSVDFTIRMGPEIRLLMDTLGEKIPCSGNLSIADSILNVRMERVTALWELTCDDPNCGVFLSNYILYPNIPVTQLSGSLFSAVRRDSACGRKKRSANMYSGCEERPNFF
jgi:hypothetical protein